MSPAQHRAGQTRSERSGTSTRPTPGLGAKPGQGAVQHRSVWRTLTPGLSLCFPSARWAPLGASQTPGASRVSPVTLLWFSKRGRLK